MKSLKIFFTIFSVAGLGIYLTACSQQPVQQAEVAPAPAVEKASEPAPVAAEQAQADEPTTPEHGHATSVEEAAAAAAAQKGAHLDHDPKHGGTFFMALNNIHHLEGLFVPPGVFRLYLYDSHTHPLKIEDVKRAGGTVIWGEEENSPETPLKLSADGQNLEDAYGRPVKFPITITFSFRAHGMAAGAKP